MVDIFISYSHEDEERIKLLVAALEKQGWSVFWDRRIPAGSTWREHIGRALNEAKCVIVAWSKHSITSKWVTEEADDALHRNILVPVLLDEILPPIGFRSVQAADLVDWNPDESCADFSQFIEDVGKAIEANKSKGGAIKQESPGRTLEGSTKKSSGSAHKISKRAINYPKIGIISVAAIILAITVYKLWPSEQVTAENPELSGLVFASKIEPNGKALDADTTFPANISNLYAVFRSNMTPPGTEIDAENIIEGAHYAYLKVADKVLMNKIGWRWYFNGEKVHEWQTPTKPGTRVWLQYYDQSEGGIFGGKFSPGKYTFVILFDGNPAMSSDLIIEPISDIAE